MRYKVLVASMAALALTVATAGSASAEGSGNYQHNPRNWVHKAAYTYDFSSGNSVPSTNGSKIIWTSRLGDSAIDSNRRALRAFIAQGQPGVNSDYAEFYTDRSLAINRRAGDVNNLSFDVDRDSVGTGGAPRISVIMKNGDALYLASSACHNPIPVSSGAWERADFTGATDNCGFYDSNGTFYAADGVHTAWDAYVSAHPNLRVSYTFLVFDEPGDYLADRISLGTNRLYNYNNKRAVFCNNDEDAC